MPVSHVTFAAGGRQHRVKSGDSILVNRMPQSVGESVSFNTVLLIEQDDGDVKTGEAVAGASIVATVAERLRGEKLRIFKMRRRKSSRRTQGHRQDLTRLVIGDINNIA